MDKNIKQFPDPSIEILSMKPLMKAQKITNNPELIDFMEKNPLPTISSRVLDHLKAENNNNSDTSVQNRLMEEVLRDFPYRESVLNFFIHRTFILTNETEISLYYILFSFVSWKIKYLSTKNTESTIFILEALMHVSTISNSPLPISAFLYTITSFLEINNLQEFSNFLPLIRSFFIQNKKLPETAFALFPHCIYLLIAKKEDFNQYLIEFYELLKQVVSKSQTEFPQQIADETLVALSPSISRLEQTPIFIFSLLARFASASTVSQFLITLAVIIADASIRSDIEINLPKSDDSKVKKYEIPEHTPGITMHFPQIPTFVNGFGISNLIPFREQEDIQSLIDQNLILDIKTIFMVMYDNDKYSYQYGISLINYMNQNANNPKLVNSYPIVIYSFLLLRMRGNKIPSISELFKNKIIFNPAVICDDSMTDLNSLRGGALELYLYEGPEALVSLLNWSLSYPDLFAELIRRLISNLKLCLPLFANSTELVRLISNALLYYQKIRLKGDEEEHIDEIRATLLLFLSSCFDNTDCANKFFSDSIFIRVFISLAFEPPLRNFVFSQLKKLFIEGLAKQKQQHYISDETKLIFESIELSFPDIKSLELANQFLEVLCDLVNYQKSEFKKEFSIITPILFNGFSRLNSSSESEKYVLNSIQFLTDTSNFFEFKKCHFEILHNGIQRAFNLKDQIDLHHQLFGKISHLMAGERLSTSTTSFIVRQPFGIWLLLTTFLDTATFTNALKFVIEICQYHSTNCQQCRRGEVDLFLISVIKDRNHNETNELCFQLLTMIANNFSAPCVVENYVSMFQFEGNEVPPYFHMAMKYFVSMLTADLKMPQTMTKLVKSSVIEPVNFEFSVSNGFTLAFWIYVERSSPQYFPSIVSLQDQNGHFFHLFWASNSLRFSHKENPFEKSEKIDTQVDLRQWSFVTVTYKVIPPFYYVLPTVNGPDENEEIIEKRVKNALNGPLKIQIGGSLNNSIDSDIPCLLGPFALYPVLQENQIQDLFTKGIRAIDQIDVNPIYVYNVNNRLENQNPSFSSVLTNQVGLIILFPLFTVIDSLLDSAFEAFSSSLMIDPSVELEFANTECFSIIPYLLQETDKSQTTYQLYLKFFLLMQNLQTEELKHQLFGSIMTNFDLWIHSTIDNFLSIVKHWSRTLFPSFASEVSIITPFASVLNQFMIYFHEDDLLNSKLDLKSPLVAKCKTHLINLLQFIATISFDFSDFALLISYINHLYPNPLSLDAAFILKVIAHSEPSPLEQFAMNPNFLPYLHSLLKLPKVCSEAMEIILLMFFKKFITHISLREEVFFCIHLLTKEVINNELFALVVQQTVSTPELFPLSCYLSSFFGDQSLLKMIELFQPSPDYIANDDVFYPIVTAHFLGKEARYSILSFLAQCSRDPKKWININFIIKIVEKCFEDTTRELEAVYLNALVDILMKLDFNESKNMALIKLFTKMAKSFIFFKEPDERRSILIEKNKSDDNQNESFSYEEIVEKFESFEFIQPDTTFGLRFGQDNVWLDSNLAMKIVELLMKKKIQTALNLNLMLAFYLVNDQTAFVREYFSNFTIPKQNKESLEPFVALLARKLQRFNIESTISSSYRNLKYDDNVFEKFIKKNSEKIKLNSKTFNNSVQPFFVNCAKLFNSNCQVDQNQLKICITSQNEMIHKIVSKSLKNEKKWRRIRHCLTLPFAPWYRKNNSDVSICKNTRLCSFGFPALSKIKSRRNLPYFQVSNGFSVNDRNAELINDLHLDLRQKLLESKCRIFRPKGSVNATVFLFSELILIIFNEYKTKQYFMNEIIEINVFIIQNQDSGIEIFFTDGKSLLIDFLSKNIKENAMNILHKHTMINNVDLFKIWRNREITTFDFLLRLNRKLSRSFNYPLRPPVFPRFLIKNNDHFALNFENGNDEIDSEDMSEILHSSLHQIPEILKTQERQRPSTNLKVVSFDPTVTEGRFTDEQTVTDEDDDDENDEILIDGDDLDYLKISSPNKNNQSKNVIPSASLINPKQQTQSNFDANKGSNQQVIKLEKRTSIYSNKGQNLPGSVGRFSLKNPPFPPQQLNTIQENEIQENSSSKQVMKSNPLFEIDSTRCSLKLSEIIAILSEGGTCGIDYYIMNDDFYQRRKILESDDVSANLNLWLSKVFKLPAISMRIPRNLQVFKPYFIKTNLGLILHASISTSSNFSYTSSIHEHESSTSSTISIDIVGKNGILTRCLIHKKDEIDDYEFESDQFKINGFDDRWLSSQFQSLSSDFVIFSEKGKVIQCFDKESNKVFKLKSEESFDVSCFVTSNSYLLTSPETSSINVYTDKNLEVPINTHEFFQSPALCAAISESFHTIVIGSEGRLIVTPLESGSSMMAIDIDGYTPLNIVITENFGFVVTHAMKVIDGKVVKILFLHNIDGKLLSKKIVSIEIDLIIQWSDRDGIDYLAVTDESGKIMVGEAYELTFPNIVKRCMSQIVSMKYSKLLKSLVAVTVNGNIFIEPVFSKNNI